MQLHIENVNITLGNPQTPAGLIAALAIASAAKSAKPDVPAVGEKWPGLEAVYGGISLSKDGSKLVHLLLWPDDPTKRMTYEQAVKYAEGVKPEMDSHIPTRHQSIDLFERLQGQFNQDYYHWTLTKTSTGNAAFCQGFGGGNQYDFDLSAECRVRAVSEIQL